MENVDVPQVLISFSAIFGIALVWYDFNIKVFYTVRDPLSSTLYDKDSENAEKEEDEEDEENSDDEDDEENTENVEGAQE